MRLVSQSGTDITTDTAKAILRASILGKFGDAQDMGDEDFIEKYCQIESKDDPEKPVIPFKLWPAQKNALKELQENKLNIILKARQLGLTWLVLCLIVRKILRYPGYTAIVVSDTEPHSKDLVNRVDLVLRNLPDWLIIPEEGFKQFEKAHGRGSYTGLYYVKSVLSIEIVGNGERAKVKVQPATEGAGRSITGDLVFFDEWAYHRFASEIFNAAFPTINRPGSGIFIGLSTNQRGSYFEDVWRNASKKNFHTIFIPWYADPARTDEWYENTKMALGSKTLQEYPATEEDALLAGDNIAFPEFSESIHVVPYFEPPSWWRRWGAVDNGYNDPFAWYKLAVSDDGIVYIYYELTREPDEPKLSYSEQARIFASDLYLLDKDGNMREEELDYIVCGQDAWNRVGSRDIEKNLIDYYREGGLERQGFVPATTNRRHRKATWHEYLKPLLDKRDGEEKVDEITGTPKCYAKIQIMDNCPRLIEEMKRLVTDPYDPEKVKDGNDNRYDSAGYGILSFHKDKSTEPGETHLTEIQRDKQRLFHRGVKLGRRTTWR